jgi:hypothetical protein
MPPSGPPHIIQYIVNTPMAMTECYTHVDRSDTIPNSIEHHNCVGDNKRQQTNVTPSTPLAHHSNECRNYHIHIIHLVSWKLIHDIGDTNNRHSSNIINMMSILIQVHIYYHPHSMIRTIWRETPGLDIIIEKELSITSNHV